MGFNSGFKGLMASSVPRCKVTDGWSDHSAPQNAKPKNARIYTQCPTSHYNVLCLIKHKNILTLKESARTRSGQLLVSLCGAYERAGAGSYWGRCVEEDTPGAGRKVELEGVQAPCGHPQTTSTQPFQNRHKNSCRALRLCSSELTYLWVTPHIHDSKLEDVIQLLYFIYLCQKVETRSHKSRHEYIYIYMCIYIYIYTHTHTHTHTHLSWNLQTNSETNPTFTYCWRFTVYRDSFGEWKRTSLAYLNRKNRLQYCSL